MDSTNFLALLFVSMCVLSVLSLLYTILLTVILYCLKSVLTG